MDGMKKVGDLFGAGKNVSPSGCEISSSNEAVCCLP